jgi:hypothetical protein
LPKRLGPAAYGRVAALNRVDRAELPDIIGFSPAVDQSVGATTRLYAQLTEQPGEPRRVRTLYDAGQPVRTNGSAVKSPMRR